MSSDPQKNKVENNPPSGRSMDDLSVPLVEPGSSKVPEISWITGLPKLPQTHLLQDAIALTSEESLSALPPQVR